MATSQPSGLRARLSSFAQGWPSAPEPQPPGPGSPEWCSAAMCGKVEEMADERKSWMRKRAEKALVRGLTRAYSTVRVLDSHLEDLPCLRLDEKSQPSSYRLT